MIKKCIDSDQTPHFTASEPGLHCLLMSKNWVNVLKMVKERDLFVKHKC